MNDYDVYSSRIEFRRVFNDVRCSEWKPIPDLFETSFSALQNYLIMEYKEDPELQMRGSYDRKMVMDKFDYQYRGVEHLPEKLPTKT